MPLVVSLVHGESLTRRRLCEELARYDLLVTFNSNSFDLPRPPCNDPRSPFGSASMDLCVLGRQLGYRGGLKAIEQQLRLSRRADLWGMNGAAAGQLRNRWRNIRDEEARQRLLAYNQADCVNIQPIGRFILLPHGPTASGDDASR